MSYLERRIYAYRDPRPGVESYPLPPKVAGELLPQGRAYSLLLEG